MPRIRSIKPEFWVDEGVAKLPRDARLLYLGLFNFSDDYGRMRGNTLLIRSQIFPYDSDLDVEKLLVILASPRDGSDGNLKPGFIRRYVVEGESYIHIRNFTKHQKIDHPSKPQFPEPPPEDAPPVVVVLDKTREPSREVPQSSRSISLDQGSGIREQGGEGTSNGGLAPTAAVWTAYSDAYEKRYGEKPVDNAKQRGLLKRFLQLVPKEEAPLIAAFYVGHPDAFYARTAHALEPMVKAAEKLRMEWSTGNTITATQARLEERTQANFGGWAKHLRSDNG